METLWRDLTFAWGSMTAHAAMTAAALVSLALGIGANATIFTLLKAILLAPLPVMRPSELVVAYTTDQVTNISSLGGLLPMSHPNFEDFRDQNQSFAGIAACSMPSRVSLMASEEPQQGFAELVTGNDLAMVGVYGVLAYAVAQRTREIDVPMALAIWRVVALLLYGLSATDPATFATVGGILLLIAIAASWIPAWRASRLDPMRALRA